MPWSPVVGSIAKPLVFHYVYSFPHHIGSEELRLLCKYRFCREENGAQRQG
jgi:hypothetical protein